MSSEKKMIDLPDNLAEMDDEDVDALVDAIYEQLTGKTGN